MATWVLAADIGGTHTRAAVVNEDGEIAARSEFESSLISSASDAVARLSGLLDEVSKASGLQPACACLGVPGLVDADRGTVVLAPNLPEFRGLALARDVEEKLGLPVFVENDANAAALGEYRYGAGRGVRHLLHATLGTGIGGGLVIHGRLYRGARGLAGEIGHVIVDQGGPRCNCGSRGCLEALVSGWAFAARAKRLLEREASPVLAELVGGRAPTGQDLFEAAERGCARAAAEIRNGGHLLGLTLGSLVNVMNPDVVTLSGGLLAMGALLLDPTRAGMRSIAYGSASATKLLTTTLGEDAGLLGAGAVAFERIAASA